MDGFHLLDYFSFRMVILGKGSNVTGLAFHHSNLGGHLFDNAVYGFKPQRSITRSQCREMFKNIDIKR